MSIGASVPRREDARFLVGKGQYIGDLSLPGMVEVAVVRSPWPHARITGIEIDEALSIEGVLAVVTAKDLKGVVKPFTRTSYDQLEPPLEREMGIVVKPHSAPVLAEDRVVRVGEPVAAVVANDRYIAEDALEQVFVDYEPLPSLTDPRQAMEEGAVTLHDELGDNTHTRFVVTVGDPERALRSAPHRLKARFAFGRSVGTPLETRGVVAQFDEEREELSVWSATQRPHLLKSYLAEMLSLAPMSVRVVAPDIGGSFGGNVYNEDILIPYLARRLGRPVRWIEDRREHFMSTRHSRDQHHDVEVGFDEQGRILAITDSFLLDAGAYNPFALTISYNTAAHLRGPYHVPNFRAYGSCILTNKTPNTPVRGAGRPEATFVMERVIDMVAGTLDVDPVEIRMRNLIPLDAMPYDTGMLYRDGRPLIYDSGDYPDQFLRLIDVLDYEAFRAKQKEVQEDGRRIGIGFSHHVEATGRGPYEGATVRLERDGSLVIYTGAAPQGQGHETTLAQVCAERIGISPEAIYVRTGDTSLIERGVGTFASRTAVTAGTAVHMAAGDLRERILDIAAYLLEVAPEDLKLEGGVVFVRGDRRSSLPLAEVASAALEEQANRLPSHLRGCLVFTRYFAPSSVTFSAGAHGVIVEVDDASGNVDILRYVVVDDTGRIINPMIVEGQVHGGVAHGVSNALYEEMIYDSDGQPLTTSFVDYLLVGATEAPPVELHHVEHRSPLNPLGIKGVGEGGAVSPPAAIANAVVDALRPLRVTLTQMPLTPERVMAAIRASS